MKYPADRIRGDPGHVAHGAEVTEAELALVARRDRHGNDAHSALTTGGDEHGGLEHEVFRGQVDQVEHRSRIESLAALRIGDGPAARQRDAPVGNGVGAAPAGRPFGMPMACWIS